MEFIKKHKGFLILLLFVIFWFSLLLFISPREMVDMIGLEMGYLLIFVTAFIGVSGFTSAPYYATLITFMSTGEFNIFLLLLIVAPTMAVGDAIFFFLGQKGHFVLDDLSGKRLQVFSSWLKGKSYWATVAFAYLYTSLSPLPQDLLMIALGLGKLKFRHIFWAVLFGNATFVTLIYLFIMGVIPILPFGV